MSLEDHLRRQLGLWPPTSALTVAGSDLRLAKGWDGRVRPCAVLISPLGTVISVAPALVPAVQAISEFWGTPVFDAGLGAVLGLADRHVSAEAVYRWCEEPAAGLDTGEWVDVEDERVPPWLFPFNGGVLCAWDGIGAYSAGVGIKHHDAFGEEIAVGTEPSARGKGLARALVSTAAREILARGAVPTYVHAPDNVASAHVADAAGFPDRGWRLGGFFPLA